MEEEPSKPESAKQLKEHLQLQQEPFPLHNFPSERSFIFNNFTTSSHSRSFIDSEESFNYEKHRIIRNRFFNNASRIVRSLFFKFIPIADDKDVHSSNLAGFQTFTVPKFRRIEVDTSKKSHWITKIETRRQHHTESKSVSRFKSHEAPVTGTTISTLSQKSTRNPFFLNRLKKLLILNSKKHRLRSKRTLQKRKQLLFGSAEKSRKLPQNEGKSEHDVNKITHLLHKESWIISEEWRDFHKVNRDIHMELGDAIMDDIVKEMLGIFLN